MKKISNQRIKNKLYKLLKKISQGKVTTYKALAIKLKTSPRAIGRFLNKNPNPIEVPCHRVIMSDRNLGGYKLGKSKKAQLLKQEGVEITKNKVNPEYITTI